MSRQKAAEHYLEKGGTFIPWLLSMILFSMFVALSCLTAILLWTIYEKSPAYGLLWEIAFCLLVGGAIRYYFHTGHRQTVNYLKDLGLRCPLCDKSPIFEKERATATSTTGKCWNCDYQFFDPNT